jgi:hypothetical protein
MEVINAGLQGRREYCSESCLPAKVYEEPMTEEPMTEEPMTEEPMTEEPMTEEPMTEKPVIPLDCEALMIAPANGNVEQMTDDAGDIEYRYSCDTGFHLEGLHFTLHCIKGFPTGTPPKCVETGMSLQSGGCQGRPMNITFKTSFV